MQSSHCTLHEPIGLPSRRRTQALHCDLAASHSAAGFRANPRVLMGSLPIIASRVTRPLAHIACSLHLPPAVVRTPVADNSFRIQHAPLLPFLAAHLSGAFFPSHPISGLIISALRNALLVSLSPGITTKGWQGLAITRHSRNLEPDRHIFFLTLCSSSSSFLPFIFPPRNTYLIPPSSAALEAYRDRPTATETEGSGTDRGGHI